MILVPFFLVLVGAYKYTTLFLAICATLNVFVWMFIVSTAIFAILGAYTTRDLIAYCNELEEGQHKFPDGSSNDRRDDGPEGQDNVKHVVVLANYKEDEAMLAETLQSLTEAKGSSNFMVVLAMEGREVGADAKAQRLQSQYQGSFTNILATFHPATLVEKHQDGSSDDEVAGKASNLKWAVARAHECCLKEPNLDMDSVIVTVSDADCLFHPYYFDYISRDFYAMRRRPGEQQKWTMWQAPQLPYRNYYPAPAPSRVWAYISTMYEAGGVSSLPHGGHHMVFSAYSLSLQLGVNAQVWGGDVIAEDHHAYLKCFFYSAKVSAEEALAAEEEKRFHSGCQPKLKVRQVMLPVKSTSVISSEGYWMTYVERWHQAVRHCQGVAELSCSFLCTWDLLCTMPSRLYSLSFLIQLFKVNAKIVCMHTLPNVQALCLAVLTLYWLYAGRRLPVCPDQISWTTADDRTILCGLAGAWVLTWPVVIPLFLVAVSNILYLKEGFLRPAERKGKALSSSIWHSSDGGVKPTFGSCTLTCIILVSADCIILTAPLMMVYGLLAELIGCWNVMIRGNRFTYITAAKLMGDGQSYGTMNSQAMPALKDVEADVAK